MKNTAKILIGSITTLVTVVLLTKKYWMLPFIKINFSSDKKICNYKLFAGGNLFEGSFLLDSDIDTIKKEIGEYEFKVYPPFKDEIKAYIYKGDSDVALVEMHYNILEDKYITINQKNYADLILSSNAFKAIGFASVIYMGVKLNQDAHKKGIHQ
jgi:hypothetical protein